MKKITTYSQPLMPKQSHKVLKKFAVEHNISGIELFRRVALISDEILVELLITPYGKKH